MLFIGGVVVAVAVGGVGALFGLFSEEEEEEDMSILLLELNKIEPDIYKNKINKNK